MALFWWRPPPLDEDQSGFRLITVPGLSRREARAPGAGYPCAGRSASLVKSRRRRRTKGNVETPGDRIQGRQSRHCGQTAFKARHLDGNGGRCDSRLCWRRRLAAGHRGRRAIGGQFDHGKRVRRQRDLCRLHKLAMDHATVKSVRGDFSGVTFSYFDVQSRFFRDGDRYLIETDGPDGKLATSEIKYTSSFPMVACRRFPSPGTRGRRSRADNAGFISIPRRTSAPMMPCTGPD